jgi:hypothetical protein
MDVLNTPENLESLKQRAWRRYRHIQGIEQSKRDFDDIAFLENFKVAVRMWDWTFNEQEAPKQKQHLFQSINRIENS